MSGKGPRAYSRAAEGETEKGQEGKIIFAEYLISFVDSRFKRRHVMSFLNVEGGKTFHILQFFE